MAVPDPDSFARGIAAHKQGRLNEAEYFYEMAVKQQPAHFEAIHLLGIIAAQTQRFDRAVELIRKAIATNPHHAAAHSNLGNALREMKRPQEALESYDKGLALEAQNADLHLARAMVLEELMRLDEALVALDKSIQLNPRQPEAYAARGNLLLQLQRPADAITSFDRSLSFQQDAKIYINLGNALQFLKRDNEALDKYSKALELDPRHAGAYNNRANVLVRMRRLEEALDDYDRAIALCPTDAATLNNRSSALREMNRVSEALQGCDAAIRLRPTWADAYNNRGLTLQDLGRHTDAIIDYTRAIEIDPGLADAHNNRSHCLLLMGRLDEGWKEYEWRKRVADPVAARIFEEPLWLGQHDIAGKTLFLWWEQGFGDTIQFCRYAKIAAARGAKVIMSVQGPLRELLQRSIPEVDVIDADRPSLPFDYHCPLLSLPLAFGETLSSIPAQQSYIAADAARIAAWVGRLRPKTKPRIGVVWGGSSTHRIYNRSMPLQQFLPVLGSFDADWICLQKEINKTDRTVLEQDGRVLFLGHELTDFSETAALISLMDAVVSIDTSLAHLAGAMGKPMVVLLAYNANWRWFLGRTDSPFYPSARLIRQQKLGDWSTTIESARAALLHDLH